MANKTSSKTTTTKTTTQKTHRSFAGLVDILAYIGIMLVAVALILAKVGGASLASAMTIVANAIAYLVTAVGAFYYARKKRNIWYFIAFVVAVILIIVFMIV